MLDILNEFVGLFFRTSEVDKWHWREECPEHPYTNYQYCAQVNDIETVCKNCIEIELNELNKLSEL